MATPVDKALQSLRRTAELVMKGQLIGRLRAALEKHASKLTPQMRDEIELAIEEIQLGRAARGRSRIEKILKELEANVKLEELTNLLAKFIGVKSFEELMASRHTIIKDPAYLEPLSDPPGMSILGRDRILQIMRVALAESLRSKAPRNLFLFGPPGSGKTLCAKGILAEVRGYMERHGVEAHVVYVNAGQTRSPYYTLLEIVRQMGVHAPPSGWQFTRLKSEFEKARGEKPTIIAIDEVDAILLKEREPLVYYLNRQPHVTLMLISNRFQDLGALPARAKSSLQPIPVIFKAYGAEEAYEILKARAAFAFQPETVPEEVLMRAAYVCARVGDIRFGFNLLLTAALTAEASGKQRLDVEDLEGLTAGLRLEGR